MANRPNIRFEGYTDDWEQRKLSDIYTDIGNAFVGTATPYYVEKGHFYLESNNIKNGQINHNTEVFINDEFYEKQKDKWLHTGDMVMVQSGHVGHAAVIPEELDCSAAHALIMFRNPKVEIEPYFLNYQYQTAKAKKKIENITTGNTIKHILASEMQEFVVDVASYGEQEKIAGFFRDLDNLITLHQRKLDGLQLIKKSLLQKMFPKDGETKPEIRFAGFTDAWEQRKVSEVAEIVAGGTPSTTVSNYWNPKEIPWLSSGEVHKKYITFTDNMISKEGMNNSSAKIVPENSVLIALAGQGKTRGTVAINRIPLTTNQSIAAMSFNDDIVPEFIFCNLEGRYDEIRKMSSGDGARGGLNKQLVGDIVIPFTGKEEQALIGSCFTNLDNLITLHQRKLEQLKTIKRFLLQKMFV